MFAVVAVVAVSAVVNTCTGLGGFRSCCSYGVLTTDDNDNATSIVSIIGTALATTAATAVYMLVATDSKHQPVHQ